MKSSSTAVIHLIQFFSKRLNSYQKKSQNVCQEFSKMLQNLMLDEKFVAPELQSLNWKSELESLFTFLETLKLRKINFEKVKKSEFKKFTHKLEFNKYKESLKYMYDKVQTKLQSKEALMTKEDMNMLVDQFEN